MTFGAAASERVPAISSANPAEPVSAEIRERRHVWNNVTVLLAGTAASQVIAVAASPILSRLYTPSDFGAYGVYNGLFGVLAVVSSLHLELAVPLPRRKRAAAHVLSLANLVLAAFSAIVFVALWGLGRPISSWLHVDAINRWFVLLPLTLLLAGLTRNVGVWATRNGNFPIVAQSRAAVSLAQVSSQIVVGAGAAGPLGLICGQLFGQLVGTLALVKSVPTRLTVISKSRLLWGARRYSDLPRYATLSSAVNLCSSQLPLFGLAYLFGPGPAGLFALGQRLLQVPAALLGQSFSQSLLVASADSFRRAQQQGVVGPLLIGLTGVAVPLFAAFAVAGPELFGLAFGQEWATAGLYVRVIAPWLLFSLLASSFSTLFTVMQKQRAELAFQAATAALTTVAMLLGSRSGTPLEMLVWISVSGCLVSIAKLWWVLSLAGLDRRQLGGHCAVMLRQSAGPIGVICLSPALLPGRAGAVASLAAAATASLVRWLQMRSNRT